MIFYTLKNDVKSLGQKLMILLHAYFLLQPKNRMKEDKFKKYVQHSCLFLLKSLQIKREE